MHRAFTFLLQPTARQRGSLAALLNAQRELYNAALEERRGAWRWERRGVTRFEQYRTLTALRDVRPDVLAWGVTVCRGTLARLDEAFQGFYRRCARGQKPGFPRFKGAHRWDSVSWPDAKGWRLDAVARRLYLQGVGHVKVRLHRSLRGVPKTCTVRQEGRRFWVTVFCTGVPAQPLPPTGRAVGIDLGVRSLVATSDGDLVDNPRHGRRATERLAAAQQSLARKQRASQRWRRAVDRVAAAHRKVRHQRRDRAHQLSRALVDGYDVICHEDLQIPNMTRRPAPRPDGEGGFQPNGAAAKSGLNSSIYDAGWGQLLRFIAYKAEEAGRQVVAVAPHHTSQTCAECGHRDGANRRGARFGCTACGHEADADVNAACNILRAGLARRLTA